MPGVEDSDGGEEPTEGRVANGQDGIGEATEPEAGTEPGGDAIEGGENAAGEEEAVEALRRRVEEQYDFEEFTPADMAEMSAAEWEAVFDPETWITGERLLDRIEADLVRRVAERDVFAVVERLDADRVLAYSDRGYAIVHGSGRIEGEGSILREVEPIIALCAMEEYEVEEPTVDQPLPDPGDVEEGSGRLGHLLLQVVAAVQVLGGIALLAAPLFTSLPGNNVVVLTTAAGLGFLVLGILLFVLVANARLSGRFRAEEYRERLEAAGVGREGRPDFVPVGTDDEGTERGGSNDQ